jgi:non-specific serine/threonine protein kinase
VLDLASANGGGAGGAVHGILRQGAVDHVLDERAKRDFRHRLEELRAEAEEAERNNDRGRGEAARTEIDALTEQLASAVGLGGRDRTTGAVVERARSSVTKAIRSAIRLIGMNDPALSRLLAQTVHTGTFCSYQPPAEMTLSWDL